VVFYYPLSPTLEDTPFGHAQKQDMVSLKKIIKHKMFVRVTFMEYIL